eukprot:CAMPEP_0114261648 /NCGR_PEP_ID=MMETSP0058-20121206/21274_1 /TAXON_ID=36894 /ORGANISM="Pyramimonas parkeae, CCMP726" /LENGTH=540 /DNA_ID=CAMNT_0001377247 /DNA_START=294 /DNA_END=1916 /DNA_ORIENTATION=-
MSTRGEAGYLPSREIASKTSRKDKQAILSADRAARDISELELVPNVYDDTFSAVDLDYEDIPESSEMPSNAAQGTVLGAIMLIIGSTIGAGILALPATVGPAGFTPTMSVLSSCWLLLLGESLLIAEVNVAIMREKEWLLKEHRRPVTSGALTVSITEMAARTLGPWGQRVAAGGYSFTAATMMVAYVAKSGEIYNSIGGHSNGEGAALFCLGMAVMLLKGGTKAADYVNRLLSVPLLLAFAYIAVSGGSVADFSTLSYADWDEAKSTVPVIFLCLVYHDLVPVLCSYLGGDIDRIRKAIIFGSVPPLMMFVLWTAVALGMMPPPDLGIAGLDPMTMLAARGDPTLAFAVQSFSVAAIVTSAIGTSLALADFVRSALRNSVTSETVSDKVPLQAWQWWDDKGVNATSVMMVFLPPLVISQLNPDIFLDAANFAGAYGMTTLYGVMPPLMAWQMRGYIFGSRDESKDEPQASGETVPQQHSLLVPGGPMVLAGLGACAAFVQISKITQDLNGVEKFLASTGGALEVPIAFIHQTINLCQSC